MSPTHATRRAREVVAVGLGLALSPSIAVGQIEFEPDVRFDTVAIVGGADETNPLLLYEQPWRAQLVGSSTVVFADTYGGILTSVDLRTGRGWTVDDGGGSGPGEFDGQIPVFSAGPDTIHVATRRGAYSSRSLGGDLLRAGLIPDAPLQSIHDTPLGLLDGGSLIVHASAGPNWDVNDSQELWQEVRAYSATYGLVWTFRDLAPLLAKVVRRSDGTRSAGLAGPGAGVGGVARRGTIVLYQADRPWLLALEPNGAVRRRIELDHDVEQVIIDAEERVWVSLWAKNRRGTGSHIVLDRNLNVLFRAAEGAVEDAFGDRLLTTDFDEHGVVRLILLDRDRR